MSDEGASPRWLLFAFQLPTHPSNTRVKTWRRLQQIGAVPTRNAVYVLPNRDQCREDFEWLRAEIGTRGGAATVFAAATLDPEGEEDIVGTFRQARDADYRALARDAERLLASAKGKTARGSQPTLARRIRALRERFVQIEAIDFHHAGARQKAAESLAALDRSADRATAPVASAAAIRPIASVRGRRWVTRPRPGIDRMASAWLIRRFIDPKARFAFVGRPSKADLPFDMYTGDFSHDGGLCTFEVLCRRFAIADPVAVRVGHIVHDLDLKETKYAPPDAPAVGRMVEGLRAMHADDDVLLEQGMAMFEALSRSFAQEAGGAGRPGGAGRAGKPGGAGRASGAGRERKRGRP